MAKFFLMGWTAKISGVGWQKFLRDGVAKMLKVKWQNFLKGGGEKIFGVAIFLICDKR